MESNILVRNLHIGDIISKIIIEKKMKMADIKSKMCITSKTLNKMLIAKSLDTTHLLKWSKVLRYDFFRLYSSHLMLHHGISNTLTRKTDSLNIQGIHIRKNVYTKDLIQFLINKVQTNEMTPMEVINQYAIPKTTFYKWLQKYAPNDESIS
jgi:predicted transcriptional regulator